MAPEERELLFQAIPNPLIFVDRDMKVLYDNGLASRMFSAADEDMTGRYLFEYVDTHDFETVFTTRKTLVGKRVNYRKYDVIALVNITYVEALDGVLGVFQDISMEAEKSEKALKRQMKTVEMAQKVIDKQMMVAQEIAGLLGETTAETKVTLTKLRDIMAEDNGYLL